MIAQETRETTYSDIIKEIAKEVAREALIELKSGVEISNFDEIKALFINDGPKINKPLIKTISSLQETIDRFEFPETINTDSKEVVDRLKELKSAIEKLNLEVNVPEPRVEVNVPAPIVNVSPSEVVMPKIDFPENDFSELLDGIKKTLDLNLNKIRTNSKERPLAVRLSDGREFVEAFKQMAEEGTRQVFAAYSSNEMFLKLADGSRWDGVVTERTGDTRFDPGDNRPDYIGQHRNNGAETTDNGWTITKFTYGSSGATRIQQTSGSWDNRASLF